MLEATGVETRVCSRHVIPRRSDILAVSEANREIPGVNRATSRGYTGTRVVYAHRPPSERLISAIFQPVGLAMSDISRSVRSFAPVIAYI